MATMRPAAVLAALVLVPGIHAAEVDDEWASAGRDVDAAHSSDLFEATSTARGQDTDAFTVSFVPGQGALRYALVDAQEPAALEMDVEAVAVVEWRDDGDGRYGPQDDTVRRIPVQDLEPTMSVTSLDGGYRVETIYPVVAPSQDGDPLEGPQVPAGRLVVEFYVLGSPTSVGGTTMDPVDVPVIVAVEDFPYEAEDTRLAFELRVTTGDALATEGAKPIHVEDGRYGLHFGWIPEAHADGAPVDARATQVLRSPQLQETQATVLFAFPRADDASQQSMVGASRLQPEGAISVPAIPVEGDGLVFALAAVGAVAAIGAPAWVRLRGGRP